MDDQEQRGQELYKGSIGAPALVRPPIVASARGTGGTFAGATADAAAPSEAPGGWMVPGLTIGKYELIRPLGRGGMGAVFLARHIQLAQRVAIKSLHVRPTRGPEDEKRLLAEARTTA